MSHVQSVMILRLVGFFFVLGFLIFVHELGHYLAARISGVRVLEFGLGYPPRLAKLFSFQGTDFTLNWIPYGGFARLKGIDELDPAPDSFAVASAWRKLLVLIAGAGMNLLLALLCFTVTYRAGVPVPTGSPELMEVPAAAVNSDFQVRRGDILLYVDGKPIEVPALPAGVRIAEKDQGVGAGAKSGQITILRRGELLDIPVPDNQTVAELLANVGYQVVLGTVITGIAEDSPAALAGIEAGDRVYSIADKPLTQGSQSLIEETHRNLDTEVPLVLLREGQDLITVMVTPRSTPPSGQGPIGIRIANTTSIGYIGAIQALGLGFVDTVGYIWATLSLPAQMIRGQAEFEGAGFIGPVGIATMVGDAIEVTSNTGLWLPVLRLTAALSAALAVINLLPLPALDGGRILFVLLEIVRRKRIEPSKEKVVHLVGMALLLVAMVAITVQDLTVPQQPIDWYGILGR